MIVKQVAKFSLPNPP